MIAAFPDDNHLICDDATCWMIKLRLASTACEQRLWRHAQLYWVGDDGHCGGEFLLPPLVVEADAIALLRRVRRTVVCLSRLLKAVYASTEMHTSKACVHFASKSSSVKLNMWHIRHYYKQDANFLEASAAFLRYSVFFLCEIVSLHGIDLYIYIWCFW